MGSIVLGFNSTIFGRRASVYFISVHRTNMRIKIFGNVRYHQIKGNKIN